MTPVVWERAWERGITDIRYGDNLALNPFEVGLERSVDLDKPGRFIGGDRLRQLDTERHRRRAVAFAIHGDDVPEQDGFWPVAEAGTDERRIIGRTWHVLYSFALESYAGDALVEVDVAEGAKLELISPAGRLPAVVISRPIVPRQHS